MFSTYTGAPFGLIPCFLPIIRYYLRVFCSLSRFLLALIEPGSQLRLPACARMTCQGASYVCPPVPGCHARMPGTLIHMYAGPLGVLSVHRCTEILRPRPRMTNRTFPGPSPEASVSRLRLGVHNPRSGTPFAPNRGLWTRVERSRECRGPVICGFSEASAAGPRFLRPQPPIWDIFCSKSGVVDSYRAVAGMPQTRDLRFLVERLCERAARLLRR